MIDKAKGAKREVVGTKLGQPGYSLADNGRTNEVYGDLHNPAAECAITAPATDLAKQWTGWANSLKPAWEPIIAGDEAAGRHAGPQCRAVGRGRAEHQRQPDRYGQHDPHPQAPSRSRTAAGSASTGRLWAARSAGAGRRTCSWTKRRRPCSTQQTGTLKSGMMKAGQQRNRSKGGGGYHGDFPTRPRSGAPTGTPAGPAGSSTSAKATKKERNPPRGRRMTTPRSSP